MILKKKKGIEAAKAVVVVTALNPSATVLPVLSHAYGVVADSTLHSSMY